MAQPEEKELRTLKTVFIIVVTVTICIGILITRREIMRSNAMKNLNQNVIEVKLKDMVD